MEWKDIDLKTFVEVYKITTNVFLPEDDKTLRIAALLNGMTFEEFTELPIPKATELVAQINFLYDRPKPEKIRREYLLNGTKYCPFRDFSEMTLAQYVDYQAVITEKFEEHLIDLMYILLIPKGHNYNDGYDKETAMEDIGSLSVTEALGLADFFLKKYRRLLRRTLLYSKANLWLAKRKATAEEKETMKVMDNQLDELLSMCGSASLRLWSE